MAEPNELLPLYLHLARASGRRNRPWVRDKLLVLAGATAAERGLDLIAAYCRRKVLVNNPGHLVGHHPSLAQALEDERFQGYLAQLRRRYTRERAEHMLGSLGIDPAREREGYLTVYEYAAALLETTPAELEKIVGDLDEADDAMERRIALHRSTADEGTAQHEPVHRAPRRAWMMIGCVALAGLAAVVLGVAWVVRGER
jgi:hypothetical protein